MDRNGKSFYKEQVHDISNSIEQLFIDNNIIANIPEAILTNKYFLAVRTVPNNFIKLGKIYVFNYYAIFTLINIVTLINILKKDKKDYFACILRLYFSGYV